MSTRQTLEQAGELARAGRVIRLSYRRPGDAGPNEFLVEPYRLHRATSGGAALHGWQLSPAPEGREGAWRDFRLDRITSVADGGRTFTPREPVTLHHEAAALAGQPAGPSSEASESGAAPAGVFHGWGEQAIAAMGPAEDYFRHVEAAMLDGKVTPEEMELARSLGERVEAHERKAAHARVYANVLQEVLQDARISHREELYLQNVRQFLGELGWAP